MTPCNTFHKHLNIKRLPFTLVCKFDRDKKYPNQINLVYLKKDFINYAFSPGEVTGFMKWSFYTVCVVYSTTDDKKGLKK